jgi:cilia- and flagella-associated protein 251
VCLFKYDKKYDSEDSRVEWLFRGKCITHLAPITGLCFGEYQEDSGETRFKLFSISEDKYLIEYNVHDSSVMQLVIETERVFRIENECQPRACAWYPFGSETLLVANTDYKLKLWNVMGLDEKEPTRRRFCVQSSLGPTYGDPISKMIILNDQSNKTDANAPRYLVYSTPQKIIGIIKLPLDGNPNKSMGLIAHPERISSITSSQNGHFVYTAGEKDYTINVWSVNY